MRLSQEWLLALLLIALYLHDAITLTSADTAFLVRRPWVGWAVRFPTVRFTLRGKHIFLPPLLPPSTAVFTLRWTEGGPPASACDAEDVSRGLAGVSLASALCFVSVLVLTPLALVTRQGTFVILMTMAFAYLSVVAGVVALWAARCRLKLPRQTCVKLTAEMLLCPPVAANLTRRISQSIQMGEGVIPAAHRLLRAEAWEQAKEDLQVRVLAQIEEVEPGSPAHRDLENLRAQLL